MTREIPEVATWRQAVAAHREPVLRSSIWQLVNSVVPYVALWVLMVQTLSHSYWITLALAALAAGFLVRIFIIFHDSGHGSFFRSRRANRVTEFVTGVLTFTPYRQWRHEHARHHATSGDLDRRGTGEIWTLTVQEYLDASRWKRFAYRLARNPLVLFGLAPMYVFLVAHRFPSSAVGSRERRGVHWTNAALVLVVALMSLTIGIKAYVLIQLPVIVFAAVAGVWLFYVQHQFEDVQWDRRPDWDYAQAALRGSSFYKLPKILQWFTGNIGFHHVHHLSPAIPNYRLERCHEETPMFREVKAITLWGSLRSLSFRLWDEQRRKLVGYGAVRAMRREMRKGNVLNATRVLSFVILAVVMAGPMLSGVRGVLDGKSFAVTMKLADGQDVENTYTFKYGTVESTLCMKYGYPGGPYTTTMEGEKTIVSGTLTNDQGDSRTIHATIEGSLMDGTVDVYEDGKMTGLTISSRTVVPKKV